MQNKTKIGNHLRNAAENSSENSSLKRNKLKYFVSLSILYFSLHLSSAFILFCHEKGGNRERMKKNKAEKHFFFSVFFFFFTEKLEKIEGGEKKMLIN